MPASISERQVLTMAAEGGLTDFDDLLRLFDVIDQQVQVGKKIVQDLNNKARDMRRIEKDEESPDD